MREGQWKSGEWRNKVAHWLHVDPCLTIVVRAKEFTADADWSVFAVFGNMEDVLADEQGHPIRFPRAEAEAAKAAGIAHAQQVAAELFEAVKKLTEK